jgi:transposase
MTRGRPRVASAPAGTWSSARSRTRSAGGLEHRNLDDIRSIGVDELSWKKGQKYLTLVYQIDHGCRRLLHVAKNRTAKSFEGFFDMLGEERTKLIAFVASDIWKAFRTYEHADIALYHALGHLPEPDWLTHRFA